MPSGGPFSGWAPLTPSPGSVVFRDPSLTDAVQFGAEISTSQGLDPNFSLLYGVTGMAERLLRLITTPRGSLVFYPNRCMDIRGQVRGRLTNRDIQRMRSEIEGEWRKDEEVTSAQAILLYDFPTQTLTITGRIISSAGPFQFVLRIDQLSAALLAASG